MGLLSRFIFLLAIASLFSFVANAEVKPVKDLEVIVLATIVGDYHDEATDGEDTLGHEGWAAYVQFKTYDKNTDTYVTKSILFDTGSRVKVLETNAKRLLVTRDGKQMTVWEALKLTKDVYFSHWHYDHVYALMNTMDGNVSTSLRYKLNEGRCVDDPSLECRKKNWTALSQLWVAQGILFDRGVGFKDGKPLPLKNVKNQNSLKSIVSEFRATGGTVQTVDQMSSIFEGVYSTGVVDRNAFPKEISYPTKFVMLEGPDMGNVDSIKDDQSLVLYTENGLVIISGCGHAGIRNIVSYSVNQFGSLIGSKPPVAGLVGGFHFFGKKIRKQSDADNSIETIAQDLKSLNVDHVLAGHCSGTYRVFELIKHMGGDCGKIALSSSGSRLLVKSDGKTSKTSIVGGQVTHCPEQ